MENRDAEESASRDDGFIIVRPFMLHELGLKGTQLLVFARIYGFCKGGGRFFESRARTARMLNVSERSVIRAIGELVDRELIEEAGAEWIPDGYSTRAYCLGFEAIRAELPRANDKMSPPDKHGEGSRSADDGVSGEAVTDWHLIRKRDNKDF